MPDRDPNEPQEGEDVIPAEFDRRFLTDIKGKMYATYAGLLDLASRKGLQELKVFIEQIPSPENGHYAAVYAVAHFEGGRTYQDVGDCSPQSTSPQLAPAALRLASTRAKARVLGDALNIKADIFEEQGQHTGGDFNPDRERRVPQTTGGRDGAAPAAPARGVPVAGNRPICRVKDCGRILDQTEVTAANKAGHPLHCKEHLAELVR